MGTPRESRGPILHVRGSDPRERTYQMPCTASMPRDEDSGTSYGDLSIKDYPAVPDRSGRSRPFPAGPGLSRQVRDFPGRSGDASD